MKQISQPPAMDDFAEKMQAGMNFGVMNAMRTGNPILDVLVCMIIPVLFGFVMKGGHSDSMSDRIAAFFRALSDWITGTETYIRYISFEDRGNNYMGDDRSALDTTARNNILQKALKLYLQETCSLKIHEAELNLLPQKSIKLENNQYGDACVFSGSYKQLLCYRVTSLPKKDHWVIVDHADPQISFRQCLELDEEGEGQGKTTVRTHTFELRARGKNAEKRVDDFVEAAFEWYKKKRGEEVDQSRYLYQPILKPSGGLSEDKGDSDDNDEARKYKRYLLSDMKTFDTLFFPEKAALLKLVDDFRDGKGKFAIPGFPNKLGLLLDGPPGTGKTSLIKSVGIYLKRHIVSVSLEKIKTNQELTDMMFDLAFSVQGEDEPIRMKFDEVVFVMEDVDCASKVVYARKTWRGGSGDGDRLPPVDERARSEAPLASRELGPVPETASPIKGPAPLSRAQSVPADPERFRKNTPFSTAKMLRQTSFVDSKASSAGGDDDEDGEDEEQDGEAEPEPDASRGAKAAKTSEEPQDDDEDSEADDEPAAVKSKGKGKELKLFDDIDKLNLSGLLNVLDGVVDTPGRVLIMTTNHPEKLDPALIRPGRINKRIHLGYVNAETLLRMAKHYVCRDCELPKHARREAEALCDTGRGITPAWVEQCSAEADDFDGLARALRLLKGAAPVGPMPPQESTKLGPKRW